MEEYQAHCDVTNPINCAKVVDASVTVTGQGDSSVSVSNSLLAVSRGVG